MKKSGACLVSRLGTLYGKHIIFCLGVSVIHMFEKNQTPAQEIHYAPEMTAKTVPQTSTTMHG